MKGWSFPSKQIRPFLWKSLEQKGRKPERLHENHSARVTWFDVTVLSMQCVPWDFSPFYSLFAPFLFPHSSIMSLLPYPHLSNIWEALNSRRMLRRATESRESAWQWLTESQWRFLIQDPAFTFTPDNGGYRPLNTKQTGAHMLCNRLTKIKWVSPPSLQTTFIYFSLSSLYLPICFIYVTHVSLQLLKGQITRLACWSPSRCGGKT